MEKNSPPRAVHLPTPLLHLRHGSDGGLKADATAAVTDKEENQCIEMVAMDNRSRPFYFRRCKRKVTSSIVSVSDDVLFTILSRLPAQCIYYQARRVCRNWYSMVHTQAFVNEHLQLSRYGILFNSKHPIFIVKPSAQGKVERYECPYELRNEYIVSCNGLILECYPGKRLVISNPATRQQFMVPAFSGERPVVFGAGLGYATASRQFKVVLANKNAFCITRLLECYILTVGADESWRHVRTSHLPVSALTGNFYRAPLITEGYMHWVLGTNVVTLDVETELFSEIHLPKEVTEVQGKSRCFLSTGRCVCLFCSVPGSLLWDFWELKEETGEWRKMGDMDLRGERGRLLSLLGLKLCFMGPVGWLEYPESIVFAVGTLLSTVVSYNLRTREIEIIHDVDITQCHPRSHKNSLLWFGES